MTGYMLDLICSKLKAAVDEGLELTAIDYDS